MKWLDKPEEIHHAATSYLGGDARAVARTPAGHPEGYLEAFAVLYREFADALIAWKQGKSNSAAGYAAGNSSGSARNAVYGARD